MTDLIKIQALTAAELLKHFEVSEEAEEHVVPETAPEVSIDRLMEAGLYPDAIKLLAHGLPKREAVWWACLSARDIQNPQTDEDNINALIAAESWVKKPSEEARLRCKALGEKTKHRTPASWAATAANWCHGSLAGPDEPAIEPPEHLYAHAVSGSVALAAVLSDPVNPSKQFIRYLEQGLDLARGGNGRVGD
ncbi:hypothetical protein SAMN04487965_2665 [Microbulbifer donghaiensis]|uniref:Uncharacterized protein n=1 Tax=Microbulbifer donghaiensis TaxID=494016 RepID=A0A1M5EDJ5_9GAMM|nr:hypothetical protein [Microbulbifer donghaiensis]SHF77257.1 hypothetical protein SAMN04487965_2665 [Microbulbifer donghaiensis]